MSPSGRRHTKHNRFWPNIFSQQLIISNFHMEKPATGERKRGEGKRRMRDERDKRRSTACDQWTDRDGVGDGYGLHTLASDFVVRRVCFPVSGSCAPSRFFLSQLNKGGIRISRHRDEITSRVHFAPPALVKGAAPFQGHTLFFSSSALFFYSASDLALIGYVV